MTENVNSWHGFFRGTSPQKFEKIVAIFAQYVKKVSILNEISYANWRYYLYFFWGPYAFHSYKAASACLTAEKLLWTGETHLFALAPGRARRYNDEKEH